MGLGGNKLCPGYRVLPDDVSERQAQRSEWAAKEVLNGSSGSEPKGALGPSAQLTGKTGQDAGSGYSRPKRRARSASVYSNIGAESLSPNPRWPKTSIDTAP